MSANYYIINLIDGLALVPSSWLTDDQKLCYWPNKYAKTRIDTAIRNREMPQISKDWSLFPILKIYGTAGTFEQGLIKLKKCEYESDLESGMTSTDDYNIELQKRTRHSRVIRKDSSESEDASVNSVRPTQSKIKSNSKLSQTKNITLSSFPEPPQSLTVINEVGVALNDDTPRIRQQNETQEPIVVATYESPIFDEQQWEMNRDSPRPSSKEITDFRTDYNANVFQTESARRQEQIFQRPKYNPVVELNQDAEFKKAILQKLNTLLSDVQIIKETIRINRKPNKNDVERGDLEVTKDLPLVTLQELQQMEDKLDDETFFQELVKILSGVGGHDLNNVTTNILKRLSSNALADECSLLGKKKKKSFAVLKLMKVVIVRFHNKDATEITITQHVARWLVQAKQRLDRELGKLQKKDAVPINS